MGWWPEGTFVETKVFWSMQDKRLFRGKSYGGHGWYEEEDDGGGTG